MADIVRRPVHNTATGLSKRPNVVIDWIKVHREWVAIRQTSSTNQLMNIENVDDGAVAEYMSPVHV